MATERIEGPTGNGGAYAEMTFMLDDWTPCEKQDATLAVIREYDKRDRMIQETIGTFTPEAQTAWASASP